MDATAVPVVDLQTDAPEAIVEALMASSCAFVTGHGVAAGLRRDLLDTARAFFDLPLADKAVVQWPGDGSWRGWQPLAGGEVLRSAGAAPELLERFEVQLAPGGGSDDESLVRRSDQFDLWPSQPAGFRMAWARYYAALGELSARIVRAVAGVLDLPAALLPDWCEDQHANLVVNNYLDQAEIPAAGRLRQPAHTDIGGLTVLWADDAPGGLEVRMPGVAGWTGVRFPDDVFLIQAGDLLARWTNQRIRANIHRVANPPAERAGSGRRISVVYFHYPRLDTVVVPAPSCVSADRPAAAAIDAGAHLMASVSDPQGRYRALEASLAD